MGDRTEIVISNGALTAHISRRGAELVRLVHRDHGDLLWTPDPAFWAATSPILFPVIGRSPGGTVLVDGRTLPMPPHGFAAGAGFTVEASGDSACTLVLSPDDRTRASYPFDFRLRLDYRLDDAAIVCRATVTNPGSTALPGSLGFHPGFRWPLPGSPGKAGHELVFPDDDHLAVRRLEDAALAPQVERLSLVDHRLVLDEGLFATSALIVTDYRSRAIRYRSRSGGPEIVVSRENLPRLGLWMRPGAPFICIEPWHGQAAPVGFAGELRERPGGFELGPGTERDFTMTITVQAAASGA